MQQVCVRGARTRVTTEEQAMSIGGLSKAQLGGIRDVMAGHVEHGEVPGNRHAGQPAGARCMSMRWARRRSAALTGLEGEGRPNARALELAEGSRASEARRARSARALDGPPGTPSLPLARRVAAELTCGQIELFLGAGGGRLIGN